MPRRILFLSTTPSPVLDIIKDLTGSAPPPALDGSTAGLTHEWHAQTAYYSTHVPLWIDEIKDVQAWKEEFLKEEAGEVVSAVGAWVYCFHTPKNDGQDGQKELERVEEVMKAVREVVEKHGGGEGISIAVAVDGKRGQSDVAKMDAEEWEDRCTESGFEFVEYAAKGKNEYGENVGFERLKEALEANEWDDDDEEVDDLLGLEDLQLADDLEGSGFDREEAEMTAELFGLKASLYGDDGFDQDDDFEGEDDFGDGGDFGEQDTFGLPPTSSSKTKQEEEVDDLDRLMGKLLAVKEQSAGLPEAERKRMAARAVRDLLKSDGSI